MMLFESFARFGAIITWLTFKYFIDDNTLKKYNFTLEIRILFYINLCNICLLNIFKICVNTFKLQT